MADSNHTDDSDNVLPFRKPGERRVPRARTRHNSKPKRQFQHHDKVVRLFVRGLVQTDAFIRWLVEEATHLHLDGWARTAPDGSMDMLIAGEEGDVRQMRSEEHTSELQHITISYAVFCLKKKRKTS